MVGYGNSRQTWAIMVAWLSLLLLTNEATAQSDDVPPAGQKPAAFDPVAAELALNEAVLAVEEGRYDDALNALRNANSAETNVVLQRGRALLGLKRAREAADEFQSIRTAADAPPELELDLSIALIGADDPQAAVPILQQYVANHPNDATAGALLTAARQQSAANRSAVGSMPPGTVSGNSMPSRSLGTAPNNGGFTGSPMWDSVYKYIDYDTPEGRHWNLTLLNATEYDSNLVLAPEFGGLGSNIEKADGRSVIAMFGDYRFIQQDNWNLGVTGSANNTFQYNLDQYNLENYTGGAYSNYAINGWILGSNYQFQETTLDNKQFAADHRITLSATMLEGKAGHVTGYYEFENIDLNAPALIPAQDRSGNLNSVGITQALYLLEGTGRFFGGYRYANTDAHGSDFDVRSQMATGRLELPLTQAPIAWLQNAVYDIEVRQFWDDYKHGNSLDFDGRARRDQRVEVRSGLQKYLSRHLSLRLDYTFVNNESNVKNLFDVEFYSYSRHIISSQVIFDF